MAPATAAYSSHTSARPPASPQRPHSFESHFGIQSRPNAAHSPTPPMPPRLRDALWVPTSLLTRHTINEEEVGSGGGVERGARGLSRAAAKPPESNCLPPSPGRPPRARGRARAHHRLGRRLHVVDVERGKGRRGEEREKRGRARRVRCASLEPPNPRPLPTSPTRRQGVPQTRHCPPPRWPRRRRAGTRSTPRSRACTPTPTPRARPWLPPRATCASFPQCTRPWPLKSGACPRPAAAAGSLRASGCWQR